VKRWMRVARGVIGTGLTFAVGIGVITSILGAIAWIGHKASVIEIMRDVGRFSVVGFLLGVLFSGVLVVLSRVRGLRNVSLRLAASLGAAAGTLYWLFLASTGGRSWTPRLALINFGVLFVMGTGSAIATLLIARKAGGSAIGSGDEHESLGAGDQEIPHAHGRSKVHSTRND